MRNLIFLSMGILELLVAFLLILFGFQLPTPGLIENTFDRAQKVTDRAGRQVRLFEQQVHDLRQPELVNLAGRLQKETHQVTANLRLQAVDFDSIKAMRNAVGDVAQGLDGLATTLDPAGIGKLSDGLRETAAYLDERVIPSAEKAADQLDKSTAALKTDAQNLQAFLKDAPLDLKAARDVHDGLKRFGEGLGKLGATLPPERLEAIRDGFEGLDNSLSSGADQVKKLAAYQYPVVRLEGLKMIVDQKPFWPEGDKIADGMTKGATGARAARKELDQLVTEWPKIREAIEESHKVVDKTRESLGAALINQKKVEPLLKDLPNHTARLAEELPKIGGDLAAMLRQTQQLKEVAAALRQAHKGIELNVAEWPQLQKAMGSSATAMKALHKQLGQALEHRNDYEAAMQQTVVLAETISSMLPMVTRQLNEHLGDQEISLRDLGESIDEAGTALPLYAETASRLASIGRLLAFLVAVIVALHGIYLLLTLRFGRRFSV